MALSTLFNDTEPIPPMVSAYTRGWGFIDEGVATNPPSSITHSAADAALYQPIFVPTVTIATRMWWANGSTTTGNVEAGIYYSTSDAKPGAKLITTGSVAQGTASQVQFADFPLVENSWSTGSQMNIYGGSGSSSELNQRCAQSFTVPRATNIRYVRLRLSKSNSPTDDLYVTIETTLDGGGTSAYMSCSSLTTTALWYTFDLGAGGVAVSPGTTYYLRLHRSGGRDVTNRPVVDYQFTNGTYADGTFHTRSNNSWGEDSSSDMTFALIEESPSPYRLDPGLWWLYISESDSLATFMISTLTVSTWDELFLFRQNSVAPGSAPATATPVETDITRVHLMGFSTNTVT